MSSSSLFELCRKYDCVKTRDKYLYSHVYVRDIYPMFLDPKKHALCKIMEIGIHKGAMLYALRDYMPKAELVGADIDLKLKPSERISLAQGDQGDPKFLNDLGMTHGLFDFIIEDGSHKLEHQKLAVEELVKYLKIGGVLFIEDIDSRYKGFFQYVKAHYLVEREFVDYRAKLSDNYGRGDVISIFPRVNVFFLPYMIAFQRRG